MFLVFKSKKILRVVLFVVSLCLIIAINIFSAYKVEECKEVALESDGYSGELIPGQAVAVSEISDFFVNASHYKETTRSKSREMLRLIIDNVNSSQKAKSEAENRLISISSDINNEMVIESILKSKGVDNLVVYINESSISVLIEKNSILKEDMAKINDVIYEITGNNNIKIVELN